MQSIYNEMTKVKMGSIPYKVEGLPIDPTMLVFRTIAQVLRDLCVSTGEYLFPVVGTLHRKAPMHARAGEGSILSQLLIAAGMALRAFMSADGSIFPDKTTVVHR